MKSIAFFILSLLLLSSCKYLNKAKEQSSDDTDTAASNQVSSQGEANYIEDNKLTFDDIEGLSFEYFFNYYLEEKEQSFIKQAKKEYAAIKTDTALKKFFKEKSDSLSLNLQSGLYKYQTLKGYDEEELESKMSNTFDDELPVLVVYANTVDGTDIFIDFKKLYEKSKTTVGNSDDDYFKLLFSRFGSYNCIYCDNMKIHDAGYSCAKLGDGTILNYLKEIIKADSASQLYYNEYTNIVKNLTDIVDEKYYLYPKSEVIDELESINDLLQETRFSDSLSTISLEHIKNAEKGCYFNCMQNTPPDIY